MARDNEAIKRALKEYDEALEKCGANSPCRLLTLFGAVSSVASATRRWSCAASPATGNTTRSACHAACSAWERRWDVQHSVDSVLRSLAIPYSQWYSVVGPWVGGGWRLGAALGRLRGSKLRKPQLAVKRASSMGIQVHPGAHGHGAHLLGPRELPNGREDLPSVRRHPTDRSCTHPSSAPPRVGAN